MIREVALAAALALAVAPLARADSATSLEADGDQRMNKQQFQLAKDLYKLALQQNPRNEGLWSKYDIAQERYLKSVGRTAGGRDTSAPASPATSAPGDAASPASGDQPAETPAEATPSPSAAPDSDTIYRSPSELIYLSRPIRSGDTSPVGGAEDQGKPIVVRTPQYEINSIEFQVDPGGSLHVRGTVKNLTADRDFRNPSVYVAIYDKVGVQVAMKPQRLENIGAVLFRGDSASFDAQFPHFTTTIGAYRVSLEP